MGVVGDFGLVEHDPGPCEVHSPGDKTDACTHQEQLEQKGLGNSSKGFRQPGPNSGCSLKSSHVVRAQPRCSREQRTLDHVKDRWHAMSTTGGAQR